MAPYITKYLSILLVLADESTAFSPTDQSVQRVGATFDAATSSITTTTTCSATRTRSTAIGPLHMSKNNDRARMENEWEHMMGEDWREFRAHLVAREHVEEEMAVGSSSGSNNVKQQQQSSSSAKDEGVGKFITGAISSIFSKGEKKKEESGSSADASALTATEAKTKEHSLIDIFDGHGVGGATKFSKIEVSSNCDDPFMDEEECHLIYDEPDVKLDKHRWAHPLFHVEPGCILVANEKLGGVFHQTVVLIIDHNEATGSTGMVINRPFPGQLIKIASDTESNIDLSLKMAFSKAPVAYGGPVMQDQFSTLHGFGEVMGSKKVCPGVFVGGSSQLMQEVRRNNLHPTEVLFVKGHAAWVPGQLTREIEKGVWYIAAASADLILRYAGAPVEKDDNPSDLWADVLSCMGAKFEDISVAHSGRGDDRMMP
eukprot:CAMPEP_0201609126 /NCGR_PEP_ID=MMETSP0492-20130828/11791_1 /ASSEMBLY_ACC=CAM_ASM_000837 /TAXON_ID=420259 /ORGANISM="Thalassiosira gravida, Strain GMp14c1" /LENGTH=428 /DNA_ID=CAMNT_0048074385 /DNA_START=115 /DNA_END=1401 /DNA_ORIENTATION=-